MRERLRRNEVLNKQAVQLPGALDDAKATVSLLADMLKDAPVGFAFVDERFRFILTNESFARLEGASTEGYLGRKMERVAPDLWKALEPHHQSALEHGASVMNIRTRSKKAGETRHLCASYFPVRLKSGTLVGTAVLLQDVTERRRFNGLLSHEGTLLDTVNDAVISTNRDFLVTSWNRAAEQMYGYAANEAIGRPFGKLVHDKDVPGSEDDMRKALAATGSFRRELIHQRKNGRRIFIETTVIALRDSEAKPTGYVSVNRDITDRRRAEETLRLEAQLLDAATDAILLSDSDGTIFHSNQAARSLYGYAADELMRMRMQDLVARDDSGLVQARMQEVLATGEMTFEALGASTDGRTFPVEVHAKPVETGQKALVLSVVRDITRRVEAARALKESVDKLERMLHGTVGALATTAERRDPYTAGHQRRVSQLASEIGREMGLSADRIEGISVAAALHDIGKMYVPAELLSKPGKLGEIEMDLVRIHPQAACDILSAVEFPWPVAKIVLQHHERLDGSGYPAHLKSGDIIEEAKILAVADTVEAMSSHRPYRPGLGSRAALSWIGDKKAELFEPEVVDCCTELFVKKGFAFDKPTRAA